jgi:hypothetical protein
MTNFGATWCDKKGDGMFKKAFVKRWVGRVLVVVGVFTITLPAWGSEIATSSGKTEVGVSRGVAVSSQVAMAEKQPGSGFTFSEEIPLSRELQEYTFAQCRENGLSYELVLALMWRESRFQVTAVGYNRNGTCDNGVMQINDVNRGWLMSELGITDLMDPRQNIAAGTTMLGRLAAKYGEHKALMAYQYGETGMKRKLAQGVTTNDLIRQLYLKRAEFVALLGDSVRMV